MHIRDSINKGFSLYKSNKLVIKLSMAVPIRGLHLVHRNKHAIKIWASEVEAKMRILCLSAFRYYTSILQAHKIRNGYKPSKLPIIFKIKYNNYYIVSLKF